MAQGAPAGDRPRASRVLRGAAAAAVLALLAGCSSSGSTPGSTSGPGGTASGSGSAGVTASASPSPSQAPAAAPQIAVDGNAEKVSYKSPVKLTVTGGSLTSVQVASLKGGTALDGDVSPDGTTWASEEAPKPNTEYTVQAQVKDANGQDRPATTTFTVNSVPVDKKVAFTVTPQAGSTVGIAQPIVVRFLTPVTEKAAVEKKMLVEATTPDGSAVEGSWHWLGSYQVDWRPKEFWAPGTKVKLSMNLAGVKAAKDRYGRKDYSQTFTIGSKQLLKIDLTTHQAKLYHGDKLVKSWPTGGGKRGLETYSGTYVVLDKSQVVQMDSCSARITCDKKNPEYYDQEVFWATRITRSGTFVHAAPWDGLMGRANVSHGCVHLATANAKYFYDQARPGDPVVVSRSGRGPGERIATQDPGLYDWNISWTKWVAGSALS